MPKNEVSTRQIHTGQLISPYVHITVAFQVLNINQKLTMMTYFIILLLKSLLSLVDECFSVLGWISSMIEKEQMF